MNNIINLVFPITKGKELAADHNYHLHAALSKQFPIFNQLEGLAINTISGIPDKQGKIALTPSSKLYLRLPVEAIQQIYPLAGQKLQIGEHSIQLGNPELQPLEPITTLKARLVTIKGYTEMDAFLEATKRQLNALGIKANVGICANDQGEPKRLTLKINKANVKRSYTIVGFSVVVSDLTIDDSIKLQVHGLGGKRRLGCGVFYPNVPVYQTKRGQQNAETTIS